MNFVDFTTYIRFKTKTDATTFADANILLLANLFKDNMSKEIAKANEDFFGMKSERDLVAGQREYPFPEDVMNNVKMLEAKLDGTNFRRVWEFDLNTYRQRNLDQDNNPLDFPIPTSFQSFAQATTDETTIQNTFSDNRPEYDIFRNSIFIFSGSAIIDVEDGLLLHYIMWPADFTNLALTTDISVDPNTTSAGFPRQFHELLARRIIIDYKDSQVPTIPLTPFEAKFPQDFDNAIAALTGMNLDRSFQTSVPHDSGIDY